MAAISGLAKLATKRAGIALAVGGVAALGAAGITLASLANGGIGSDKFSGERLTFPDDLANLDHWVSFTAKQTNGLAAGILSGFGVNIGSNFNVAGGSIFLPLPSNLSTDYNPEYTKKDLGAAVGGVLKPFDRAMYGNNEMGNAAAAGGAMAGISAGIAGGFANKAFSGGMAAIGGDGSDAAAAVLKTAGGVAINPNKIVLFTGVDFRDHSFSWKLSPKNRQESDTIRDIIRMMRFYSHPEFVGGGLFFKYPEYFEIKFNHPEYLFDLRPSVCTDIKVNYHSQGYAGYVRDSNGGGIPAPVEIELTLSFREVEIITKNSLDQGFN
jgi:hypothetical protein